LVLYAVQNKISNLEICIDLSKRCENAVILLEGKLIDIDHLNTHMNIQLTLTDNIIMEMREFIEREVKKITDDDGML